MTRQPFLCPAVPLLTDAGALSGHPAFSGTPAGAWRRWDRALHLACLEGWEILPSQIPHAARDYRSRRERAQLEADREPSPEPQF